MPMTRHEALCLVNAARALQHASAYLILPPHNDRIGASGWRFQAGALREAVLALLEHNFPLISEAEHVLHVFDIPTTKPRRMS